LDRHLHGRLPHPEIGADAIVMADEPTSAGTATEAEPRETEGEAPAEDQPGTALERAEAAPPAPAPEQLPMLPGEVRPHPTPQRYVLIAASVVRGTSAQTVP